MAEIHYFDVHIAEVYGVNCAVILQNIWYWIKKNEANETNYYDGNYWTYNSTKAFSKQFPYLSKKQIETALKKLRDEEILITGNYNELKYDRTLWYAITEKGKSILHTGEMEITEKGNGNHSDVTPIPDNKPDCKTTDSKPYKIIIDYLNEKAGTSYRHTSKDTQKHINARLNEGYTIDDFKQVIDNQCTKWMNTEWEQYLRPSTLFGSKFENYLNAKSKEKRNDNGSGAGDSGKEKDKPTMGIII